MIDTKTTAAILATVLAALAATTAPARAHEPEMNAAPAVSAGGHVVRETPAQILTFWTKERLADAKPFPLGSVSTRSRSRHTGSVQSQSFATLNHAAPSPWWNTAWGRWSMVGRLYSYHPQKGYIGWCSGTVVTSANQSTIWTAGHCLVSDGSWHTKLLFVPGQNGPGEGAYGSAPYGKWPIRYVDTSAGWFARNDCAVRKVSCPWGADYGAALASTVNGVTLARWVGSIPTWFGKGLQGLGVRALGYPSDPPYFDTYAGYLFYCDSAPGAYQLDVAGYYFSPKSCGMTGGASGGPWLLSYGSTWYLVSNNSSADTRDAYGNFALPTFMNGPYLDGTTARGFFDAVQAR